MAISQNDSTSKQAMGWIDMAEQLLDRAYQHLKNDDEVRNGQAGQALRDSHQSLKYAETQLKLLGYHR